MSFICRKFTDKHKNSTKKTLKCQFQFLQIGLKYLAKCQMSSWTSPLTTHNFTTSLIVGHATTGTLNAATKNTGVGIDAMDAITSGEWVIAADSIITSAGASITTLETTTATLTVDAAAAYVLNVNVVVQNLE